MAHFTYIIYSPNFDKYYKGYSSDPHKRLLQHNNAESRYTRQFVPWTLVFLQKFDSKTEALKREKSLKKYSKLQLIELINSLVNEV